MKKDNIPDFENKISEQAAALRKSVRYSGAAAAADAKAGAGSGKTSFFSSPGVQLAAAFLTAAIVGGGTYFLCLQLGKSPVSPPPVTVNTEVTDTLPDDTGFVTETDNAVTVPAETTLPDTTPEAVTEPETTQDETTEPETTIPETTVPETTVPETTTPETTVPETTAPETTAPHTTADTEKPDPSDGIPPAPEDKNGYKLLVNHIDLSKITYYGVYADGSTVLPLSSIVAFLEPGSSEIIDDNTVILKYEDDEFTLKIKERIMTGNHYSGNWFDNKQTKTTVLYLADNSILYADGETVNAFLSEFADGALKVDKEKKTVVAKDAYYDEDTRHIPVLNESPSKFNKNGYKLYINGNKVDSVSFDVSGDGEATMPFAAVLNCLEHCEVKDFGSIVYISYDGKSYQFKPPYYELTGDGIEGNWFKDKSTLFMTFYVKDKKTYSDLGVLNDFLSDFTGGSATIDHDKKIIEIKDKYYDEEKKEPVNPDGTRYEIPFSDGAFFTVTFADENEKNPGKVRIDFYVPAKDDGNALVNASYCTFPDGARIRIDARRKVNNAIELFCFCEYSGASNNGEYSYKAFASQIELYYTAYKPDAAFPYAYTVTGKSVSFTYTDGTKDRTTMLKQKEYVPVEALVSSLGDRLDNPDQTVDTSVDPVILYEYDGTTESFLKPYDTADPFTLTAGNALFFGA